MHGDAPYHEQSFAPQENIHFWVNYIIQGDSRVMSITKFVMQPTIHVPQQQQLTEALRWLPSPGFYVNARYIYMSKLHTMILKITF
jgi:hypothetical protein